MTPVAAPEETFSPTEARRLLSRAYSKAIRRQRAALLRAAWERLRAQKGDRWPHPPVARRKA